MEQVMIKIESLLKYNNIEYDSGIAKSVLVVLKEAKQCDDPVEFLESRFKDILEGSMNDENGHTVKVVRRLVKGFKQIVLEYNQEIFNELVDDNNNTLMVTENYVVPDKLLALIQNIFGTKPGEKVATFYGVGNNVNVQLFENQKEVSYFSLDKDMSSETSKNKFALDFLEMKLNKCFDGMFDNIFVNFIQAETSLVDNRKINDVYLKTLSDGKVASSSSKYWKNLIHMIPKLNDDGKMIAIVPNSCLVHNRDENARTYFVNQGWIECVINLPKKLLNRVSIPVSIVVFSKNNENVKIIDATEFNVDGRRKKELTDENINQLYRLYSFNVNSDASIFVNQKDFAQNRYVLTDSVYRTKKYSTNDVIVLGDVSTICRPAPLSAKQLDDIHTHKDTNWCYLRLSDIQHGLVDFATLPNIISLDEKYEKYFLENGDVVISKTGRPFKIAVIGDMDGRKVLPVGNMYIIRPDKTKVNPYFIKACLESTTGTAVLNSLLTGGTVQIITVEGLKGIGLPNWSIDDQDDMEEAYTDLLYDLEKQRTKFKTMLDEVSCFLDNI